MSGEAIASTHFRWSGLFPVIWFETSFFGWNTSHDYECLQSGKAPLLLLGLLSISKTTKDSVNRDWSTASLRRFFKFPSPIGSFWQYKISKFSSSSKPIFLMRYDVGNLFSERIHKAIWSKAFLILLSLEKKEEINIPRCILSNHVCPTLRNWTFSCFQSRETGKEVSFFLDVIFLLQW